jgi:hypothetical protein
MIAYRDFKPQAPGYFPDAARMEDNFADALAEANDWIFSGSIEVINVETLGLVDAAFQARSIRVWYRTSQSKPRTSDEE